MPQIETWSRLPPAIRDHLVERMRDRNLSLAKPKAPPRGGAFQDSVSLDTVRHL